LLLGATALAVSVAALSGLAWLAQRRAGSDLCVPGVVWVAALMQVAFVLGRYGFGDVLAIEMGGAAQAKAFFPALAPLALLFAAGFTTALRAVGATDRWTTLGLFGWILTLDAVSLAVTTWQHYRWWPAGA
jgi:hypothetical protein